MCSLTRLLPAPDPASAVLISGHPSRAVFAAIAGLLLASGLPVVAAQDDCGPAIAALDMVFCSQTGAAYVDDNGVPGIQTTPSHACNDYSCWLVQPDTRVTPFEAQGALGGSEQWLAVGPYYVESPTFGAGEETVVWKETNGWGGLQRSACHSEWWGECDWSADSVAYSITQDEDGWPRLKTEDTTFYLAPDGPVWKENNGRDGLQRDPGYDEEGQYFYADERVGPVGTRASGTSIEVDSATTYYLTPDGRIYRETNGAPGVQTEWTWDERRSCDCRPPDEIATFSLAPTGICPPHDPEFATNGCILVGASATMGGSTGSVGAQHWPDLGPSSNTACVEGACVPLCIFPSVPCAPVHDAPAVWPEDDTPFAAPTLSADATPYAEATFLCGELPKCRVDSPAPGP